MTETKSGARHVHGPSIHMRSDSISPLQHAAVSDANRQSEQQRECMLDDKLLKSIDLVTEEEDESSGRVGPYQVVSLLGTGAFSKVLLAKPVNSSSAVRVALKMIACKPGKVDERMRVSWVREAEILKRISHPAIVSFYRSFRTPTHYTLVLEAVNGYELFELLEKHQRQVAQREWLVRRIFGELAHVVHWMHSINLVHRDIKLENIMLTIAFFTTSTKLTSNELGPMPLIKITDFGLARFVKADQMLETRCGSEEYAAPELILGKNYDGRKTDTWAMGVVLYAMLFGAIPFLSSSSQENAYSESAFRNARERNGPDVYHENRDRKAHLLRIVKGELRWPEHTNELCEDEPTNGGYDPSLRLVTPQARHITARFLRRDPKKRATCLELWRDPWFLYGSFALPSAAHPQPCGDAMMRCTAYETSADDFSVLLPCNPEDARGRQWVETHTKGTGGKESTVMHHENI